MQYVFSKLQFLISIINSARTLFNYYYLLYELTTYTNHRISLFYVTNNKLTALILLNKTH
ncbi:hypothetical protein NTGM5_10171 [Candidatus Nitrotoga sp. M5]|nr:hypothetical protein NTGM5_10171 [Candidatus Nitrotoga sp. M5]